MRAKKWKKSVHNLYNEIKLKHECVMYIKWSRMIVTVKKKPELLAMYSCNINNIQGRRKVWKSKGTTSNVVGIFCLPPLVWIGLTDQQKSGGVSAPPPRFGIPDNMNKSFRGIVSTVECCCCKYVVKNSGFWFTLTTTTTNMSTYEDVPIVVKDRNPGSMPSLGPESIHR